MLHDYLEEEKNMLISELDIRLLISALWTFFNVLYAGTEIFIFTFPDI